MQMPLYINGLLLGVVVALVVAGILLCRKVLVSRRTEQELRLLNRRLEEQIRDRSEDLLKANALLEQQGAELKRSEERLRQAHKMEAIGALAGGIAHDFNNILAAILGYAGMAKDEIPAWSPAGSQIDEVIKAGNRAKELVKQILTFGRQSGLTITPIEIHVLANEVLSLLRASIPTTIEIQKNIDSTCGTILADPTQIHQVILNLCTNAAQAMDTTGGILTLGLTCVELSPDDLVGQEGVAGGFFVKLSVADTGPGIGQDTLGRIFDPYFTTKEKGQGTGMGLSVVHGIVKRHGGFVTVDSSPDKGTQFEVFFPKIDLKAMDDREESGPVPTGNEHILVVDDEEHMTDLTARRLQKLGYRVTATTSSIKAMKLFCAKPGEFDLLITDQTMPEMTGDQLAQEFLRIRPDLPIILCTGFTNRLDAESAMEMGISAFIMKPIERNELARITRRLLDDKRSQGSASALFSSCSNTDV